MSCEVQGLKELIDKLETTFSEKEIQKIEQKALEPISEKIKEDMKQVSPVCDEPEIHGKDVIGIRYVKSKGYDIGLWSEADFDTWRGLWFSQWGSYFNPYYVGWFTAFCAKSINNYNDEAKELLYQEIMKNLKL